MGVESGGRGDVKGSWKMGRKDWFKADRPRSVNFAVLGRAPLLVIYETLFAFRGSISKEIYLERVRGLW